MKKSPKASRAKSSNPYAHSCTQEGFVTFGMTHVLALIQKAAFAAHTHTWHEKWFVHRRLRPEEYCGWVNFTLRNEKIYPIILRLLSHFLSRKALMSRNHAR